MASNAPSNTSGKKFNGLAAKRGKIFSREKAQKAQKGKGEFNAEAQRNAKMSKVSYREIRRRGLNRKERKERKEQTFFFVLFAFFVVERLFPFAPFSGQSSLAPFRG